jgi:hypothetical protein
MGKRSIWIAEIIIGVVAVILALQGYTTEAVAVTGFIAATMDKMVQ